MRSSGDVLSDAIVAADGVLLGSEVFIMREGLETAVNNLSSALFNLSMELKEAAAVKEQETSRGEFSFTPAKSMKEALKLAGEKAECWTMSDEPARVLSANALELAAEVYDGRLHFTEEESEKYYLVAEDGSIGLTMDGCASIDWLYKRA